MPPRNCRGSMRSHSVAYGASKDAAIGQDLALSPLAAIRRQTPCSSRPGSIIMPRSPALPDRKGWLCSNSPPFGDQMDCSCAPARKIALGDDRGGSGPAHKACCSVFQDNQSGRITGRQRSRRGLRVSNQGATFMARQAKAIPAGKTDVRQRLDVF